MQRISEGILSQIPFPSIIYVQRTFGDSVPHRHNFPNLISFSLSASHSIADGALRQQKFPFTCRPSPKNAISNELRSTRLCPERVNEVSGISHDLIARMRSLRYTLGVLQFYRFVRNTPGFV